MPTENEKQSVEIPDEIPIIVAADADVAGDTKSIFGRKTDAKVLLLKTETLRENLSKVCAGVTAFVKDVRSVGGFRLTEITVAVAVDAKGGVNLIGIAQAGVAATLTLKFAEGSDSVASSAVLTKATENA